MRKANYFLSFIFLLIISSAARSQAISGVDSTGLPGDNFSLQGALELFKQSTSPEEFERLLNTEDNTVNNLDLNEDGDIDYIRVIDKMDKDAHIFILQVSVSETESQDIAVIELEKTGDSNAILQIIGDEDIYGEPVIVEPDSGEVKSDADGNGPSYDMGQGFIVNVWFWPCVRYVYTPTYRIWISPWKWRHYPIWWHPWRPVAWRVFHPRVMHYRTGFVIVHTHRGMYAGRMYAPVRVSSVTVRSRHQASINNYRVTRTRTTVTGPRGNSVSKQTTTVRGRGGKVKASKTTVKRRRG